MTGESLNIKLRLDFSDVKSGVQKVKSQLQGMADKVRQSIPKITSESKRAEKSLDGVTKESRKVKSAIDDIGKEARDSLNDVVKLGQRAKSSLSGIGGASLGTDGMVDSADDANSSLEDLQVTMQGIMGLNFFDSFMGMWSRSSKEMRVHIRALKKDFGEFSTNLKKTVQAQIAFEKTAKNIKKNIPSDKMAELKKRTNEVRQSFWQLQKLNLKNLGASLKPVLKDIGLMAVKVAGLTALFATLLATINAFQVSKLAKEMYTASQQAGFAAQSYQEWQYVLERTGVEASELKEMMKTLSESQADILDGNEDRINAYKKLGMSIEDVLSMNQEQLWTKTVKALQNVENTTERTAIAYKLFSEDAAKLTTVLNLTNKETEQLISTYNELGGAMSKELIVNSNVLQGALVNLRAAWQGFKNVLAQAVLPAVIVVVEWLTKALVVVSAFIKTLFKLDMTPLTDNLSSGMNNTSGALNGIAGAAGSATAAVEKLKRSTMGFDELNIVSNPNTSDSSTDSGSTGLSGLGNINTGNSIFLEASKQAEELKKKIEDFVEKFKTQIAIIGGALGALGVAKLIEGLGKAIGLGDKFLSTMTTIKKIAATAITIVLQYELVNKFMDKFLDGEGWKNYLMGLLVAAIGTGVLYSMWGPTGLVIGLGVTAVASIKAVLDNGGIKDVESLTVALTGLASAIGAVYTAWHKLGLGKLITSIGAACAGAAGQVAAFFKLWKESGTLVGTLAAAFPKLATAISSVGGALASAAKAVAAFVGGLSAGTIAAIIAVVAALASAVYFLYENWEKVKKVTKDWIDTNIKPTLDDIKESWDKLKTAVTDCGKAIAKCIPDWLKDTLKEIWEWVKKAAAAFAEWFESVEWLEGLGKLIEGLGGVIVGVVGGAIMGAISGLVQFIEGVIQNITGWVEIISGVIEAIVALFTGDLDGARKAVEKIGKGIKDVFVGLYDATIGVIVKWVKGIIDWCVKLWDELVGHSIIPDMVKGIQKWFKNLYDNTIGVIVKWVKEILAKIKGLWNDVKSWFDSNVAPKFTKKYWQDKFDTVKQGASDKLAATKKSITDAWSGVTTWFKQNVAPKFTLKYWQDKFDTMRKAASEKIGGVRTAFTSGWSSITTWFSGNVKPKFTSKYWSDKFGTIKDGAKSAFNGIISIVEKAINSIIDKINTLSWRIPDWVPKYGGSSFGFNFGRVRIPRLATGGIVTESTLANIGERGPEAVLPLTGQQGSAWMDMLAGKIAAQIVGSGNKDVVLKIGETEFGRASLNAINGYMKQTGGFALA